MAGFVYILASRHHGTLYTGVTSDPAKRIFKHCEELIRGFTSRYGVKRLVWFEAHDSIEGSILREKRIKDRHRPWKIRLSEEDNPDWHDLSPALFGLDLALLRPLRAPLSRRSEHAWPD